MLGGDKRTIGGHRVRAAGGFSLVEAMIASIVLAIVATSALLPFAAGQQQANEASRLKRAVMYSQAMMDEVIARPFFLPSYRLPRPGPESGETDRTKFDCIDDFHGFSEKDTGLRNPFNGAIIDPEAPGWWRSVEVTYVSFSGQQASEASVASVRIRVDVFEGSNSVPLVTLSRLATRED